MTWFRRVTGLLLMVPLGTGCSTDDELEMADAVSKWCTAFCNWQEDCRRTIAFPCTDACVNAGGFRAYGRLEFYVAMAECLARDTACSSGVDAAWSNCAQTASMQLAPAQAAFDFCQRMAGLFFSCGYSGSPVTCARLYSQFNDDVLAKASQCRDSSCDGYQDCISTVAYGGT
jgi:hypothetical protein